MANIFETKDWSDRLRPGQQADEDNDPTRYRAWRRAHAETVKPTLTLYLKGKAVPYVVHESQIRGFRPVPDSDDVMLVTVDLVFVLRGAHLEGLSLDWRDDRAREIYEYDPARWSETPQGEPVITKIEVIGEGGSY